MSNFYKKVITIYKHDVAFDIPTYCPHCGVSMIPDITQVSNPTSNKDGIPVVSMLVQCIECKEFYALTFELTETPDETFDKCYKSTYIPYSYSPKVEYDLPKEIENISPKSKEIYQQSQLAEAYNLDSIAGLGYRKFIEFLIKDYLIETNKESKDKFANKNLSQAINEIDSPRIKNLAKSATWIGNDEAHYTKKHSDKDVQDMKLFIRSLAYYLSFEYSSKVADDFINENSSKGS